MTRHPRLASIALAFACTTGARAPTPVVVPAATASAPEDAGAGTEDGRVDPADAQKSPAVASAALTVFARIGSTDDDSLPPHGPALVLDGGFGGAQVATWLRAAVVGTGENVARGDVVILTASAADASSSWLRDANFRSAQTVSLGDSATPDDFSIAADIVDRAEVVWFTGGDQAKYVRWKGTSLLSAVDRALRRGGAVGGTSAGMIILGEHVNDALRGVSENITSSLAVANPYDPSIHLTERLLNLAPLGRAITDPHFRARDRMGRLAAFMARQVQDGLATPDILGIGVDDGVALAINASGIATRIASGSGPSAYVVRGARPVTCVSGAALVYHNLHVVKLAEPAHSYDFTRRCGKGFVRDFDLDGNSSPAYPADTYASGGFADECR